MASFVTVTVLFGFSAVLCCLQLLGGAADIQEASESGLALVRLAAASLVPVVMATMTLTQLLVFAHVADLAVVVRGAMAGNGNGGGGGAGASRIVSWLATAILVVATTALVAAAVVQLGADGHLDRGRGDVARLNIK